MKVIVAGATGLVGREIIRQCLDQERITSVVALSRKPLTLEKDLYSSKLDNVLIRDYEEYSDDVKAKFVGADICIWTVAVTPFRTGQFDAAEVKRVCQTCTLAGFKAIKESSSRRPFRFIYFSAEGTPTDGTKKPLILGDYQIMRGETERLILDLPSCYPQVEVCVVHPGVVTNGTTWSRAAVASIFWVTNIFTRALPNIGRNELAAAVIHLAINGIPKNSLTNQELVDIGRKALQSI